jgi:gluconolactonase
MIVAALLCTLSMQPKVSWEAHFETPAPTVVGSGYRFTEGPCWFDGGFLFCDVNGNRIYRWTGSGEPSVWIEPSGKALGIARGPKGMLYFAQSEHSQIGALRVDATADKRSIDKVAGEYGGLRFIDTNDLVVASDGTIYFTDPQYFNKQDESRMAKMGVYRLRQGKVELITDAFNRPNGIALSPDEKWLYVAEHGASKIQRCSISEGKWQLFADIAALAKSAGLEGPGRPDGLKFDARGNLYTTGPGGILVVDPKGDLAGFLSSPRTSNLAFGGKDGRTLFLTRGAEVATIRTKNAGARW